MKAAVLYANEDLRYDDYPVPEVRPGTVLIRVKATGICGSDVPRVLHHGAHAYPIVLGHEFSGDVEQIGAGVSRIHPGMRVTGAPLIPCMTCADCAQGNYSLCKHYSFVGSREQGSFAEYLLLPEQNVVPLGDDVSYEMGALTEPATVALHGIFQSGFRGGVDVAVLGGGTIGQFVAQWASILGARTVTMLDIQDSRLALACRLGCTAGINTAKEELSKYNGSFGAVFEAAGTPATMQMAFDLAANKAQVCFIGTPHTDATFSPAQWENMNRKEFLLTGSWMSYSAPFPGREWELTAHAFGDGRLKLDPEMIFARYPLSGASEAFAQYKIAGRVQGKIMLFPDSAY